MTKDIWELMKDCWQRKPSSRRETPHMRFMHFAMCGTDSPLENRTSAENKDYTRDLKIQRTVRLKNRSEKRVWFANVRNAELVGQGHLSQTAVAAS